MTTTATTKSIAPTATAVIRLRVMPRGLDCSSAEGDGGEAAHDREPGDGHDVEQALVGARRP